MYIKEGSIMDIAIETDFKTLAIFIKKAGFLRRHRSFKEVPHKLHRSFRGVTEELQKSPKRFLEDC